MSLTLAISFTNLGPYHLARLRALADRLAARGGRLIAYETAGSERLYPWQTKRREEPFERVTLFPDRSLESLTQRRVCPLDAQGARPRPARRRGHRRLLSTRDDRRAGLDASGGPARDLDVGEPGHRLSPPLVEGIAQGAAGAAVLGRTGRRAETSRLPPHSGHAVRPDRARLQRRGQRRTGPRGRRRAAGSRRTAVASRGSLLPRGQPVRPREEPAAPDPRVRRLPGRLPRVRRLGPGAVRVGSRCGRGRSGRRREWLRRRDPSAGLPPGR